jgi:molybdopterin-binding protein
VRENSVLVRATCDLNYEASMLSARNQFKGVVKTVKLGNVAAEVVVAVGNLEVVSMITRGSADSLKLQPGDAVTVIVKSTEVMIDK